MTATMENRSDSGVALRTPRAVPLSSPVRVDTGDEMLLGEVCHCAAAGQEFVVGLHVEHVVEHLQSLMCLNRVLEHEMGRLPATSEGSKGPEAVYKRRDQNGQQE